MRFSSITISFSFIKVCVSTSSFAGSGSISGISVLTSAFSSFLTVGVVDLTGLGFLSFSSFFFLGLG
jgi:hypothetical protein